jgi:uncharacterized integral membrane protein (TIGR00698 family)
MFDPAKQWKGILLSIVIGSIAIVITPFVPGMNEILMGLILGIIISNVISIPSSFNEGIGFTGSKLLEISVLFLAFSINISHVANVGWTSFVIVAIAVFSVLLLTLFLAKRFQCPGSTGWLIGFGTAICGSSAIAALAPTVAKNKEDVGIAIAVVNLLGTLGMIAFPFLYQRLNIDEHLISLLVGGSLHSVGNVAGAGYSISESIGQSAITIKLARVALLSPGLIYMNFMLNRNEDTHWSKHFRLPWYLWSFIAISLLVSFVPIPENLIKELEQVGKIILTIAMVAIGLKVKFKTLFQSGQRGIIFGTVIFLLMILILFTSDFLLNRLS